MPEKHISPKKAVFALLLASLLVFPSFAPREASCATNNFTVNIEDLEFVYVAAADSILLYDDENLINLAEGTSLEPSAVYTSLQDLPKDKSYEIVFIVGDSVLDSLGPADVSLLGAMAQAGTIIGTVGNGAHMRGVLNITDADDHAEPEGGSQAMLFFTYGVPDGSREDLLLTVDNMTLKQVFDGLFDWAVPLLNSTGPHAAASEGAWAADYSNDWRGSLAGGSYRLLVNGFKLKTDRTDYDWFLVTASIQSAITDYQKNSKRCGWYTQSMSLKAVVDTSRGGKLYDYMPTGTVGSTSRGFSIGGNLDTSAAGVSAGYSESYEAPDAAIVDYSNYITNTAQWAMNFSGPGYTWYPWYREPAQVARSSYQTEPAFIVQTPKNRCVKVTIYPAVSQVKDTLKFKFFWLDVSQEGYDWSNVSLPVTLCP